MNPGNVGATSLMALCLLLWSQRGARADAQILNIPRVSGPPDLGGPPSSPEAGGAIVTDFRQHDPGDGVPCSRKTTASVSCDDDHLYVVFDCADEPDKIRAHLTKREDILDDDRVVVYLDTYRDHHRAYLFASNPLGVQLDGIVTEGQDDDYTFDSIWYSGGKLTPSGYQVKMAIPFRSLRFSDARTQTWGIALGRFIPRNNEEAYWPYITKRVSGLVPQFATATGLEGISPGRNVQFIPYGISTRAKFLDTDSGWPGLKRKDEFRGGLDSKLVLHEAYTLDAALDPDFSQVESDEPQVTINQRYEVVFPERRPFFIENAGFFQTPTELFFSRRLADPQYGLRLTGKAGPWVAGALAADDRAPGKLVPVSDPLRGDRAINGVVSVRREFGQSSLGLLATSRDFGPSFNRVFSVDSRVKLTPNWFLSGQAIHAFTRQLEATRSLDGRGYLAELARDGRNLDWLTRYTDLSPDFRSQLGHVKRVDIRQVEQEVKYRWRPKHGVVTKYGPTVSGLYNTDHEGRLQDWSAYGEFKIDFTRNTSFKVGHTESFERFDETGFRKVANNLELSGEWLKWLAASATYSRGTEINYDPAGGLDPFLAKAQQAELALTLRPSPRLTSEQTLIYSGLGERSGISRFGSRPSQIFDDGLVRWKLNYQFCRPLSLRAIIDYEGVSPNASLVDLDRKRQIGGDLLATYLLNPGTALYVGYTDNRENLALDGTVPPSLVRTDSPDLSTGRQFFVKLSYLIRR